MKKEAIGDITRSGGFSRLIRDVEESGEPIIIMKNNNPAAVVMPVNEHLLALFNQAVQFAQSLRDVSTLNNENYETFLLGQLLLGVQAKALLTMNHSVTVENFDNGMAVTLQRAVLSEVQKDLDAIADEISRKAVRKFEQKQNSSEDSGSTHP